MKKMRALDDLLLDLVKDMYYAEKKLVSNLPKMAKAAKSEDLKMLMKDHLEETKAQVARLEDMFKALGKAPKGKKCHAMDGILEEGKEVLEEEMTDDVRDAALIVASQKVEHYEIASYGSIRTFAEMLGYTKVAKLAEATLKEESAADEKLTACAAKVNEVASQGEPAEVDKKKAKKNSKTGMFA